MVVVALTGGPPGLYGVQAAIAALHDEAPDVGSTDWPQIVALYDVLRGLAPSPVVELNRAVAVAMRDGPSAGLVLLEGLAEEPKLKGYSPFAAARGDLLLADMNQSPQKSAGRKHDCGACDLAAVFETHAGDRAA